MRIEKREVGIMEEMQLRKVKFSDLDLIFQWANELECRKNSFHTEEILYENHVKWFQEKLASSQIDMYLACKNQVPIGQIRLNYEDNIAMISYSVSKEERGKGYGGVMLSLVEKKLKEEKKEIVMLIGKVKIDNIASQKKFEQLGYEKSKKGNYILYTKEI